MNKRYFTIQLCDDRFDNMPLYSHKIEIETDSGLPLTEPEQEVMISASRAAEYKGRDFQQMHHCKGAIIYETDANGRKLPKVEPMYWGDITTLEIGE